MSSTNRPKLSVFTSFEDQRCAKQPLLRGNIVRLPDNFSSPSPEPCRQTVQDSLAPASEESPTKSAWSLSSDELPQRSPLKMSFAPGPSKPLTKRYSFVKDSSSNLQKTISRMPPVRKLGSKLPKPVNNKKVWHEDSIDEFISRLFDPQKRAPSIQMVEEFGKNVGRDAAVPNLILCFSANVEARRAKTDAEQDELNTKIAMQSLTIHDLEAELNRQKQDVELLQSMVEGEEKRRKETEEKLAAVEKELADHQSFLRNSPTKPNRLNLPSLPTQSSRINRPSRLPISKNTPPPKIQIQPPSNERSKVPDDYHAGLRPRTALPAYQRELLHPHTHVKRHRRRRLSTIQESNNEGRILERLDVRSGTDRKEPFGKFVTVPPRLYRQDESQLGSQGGGGGWI